jgi:hypothetical protein
MKPYRHSKRASSFDEQRLQNRNANPNNNSFAMAKACVSFENRTAANQLVKHSNDLRQMHHQFILNITAPFRKCKIHQW